MGRFSATEAAVEGFRLAREQPTAILIWAGVSLLFTLVSTAALIAIAGSAFSEIMEASRGGATADPAQSMETLARLGPAYAVILPLSLVFYAVINTAVYRAVLHPAERGFGFLRLGGDEFRQVVAYIILFLVFMLATIVFTMGLGVVAGLTAATGGGGFLVGLVVFLLSAALFAAFVWVGVRLSLFTPLVFDTGRFALGEAWGLTKGRVWPLFGAYVLTFVFVIVIYLLFLVIMSAVAAVVGGGLGGVAQIFNPDLSSLAAYFTPVLLVSTLVGSLLSALLTALGAGVVASAYGQIAARKDVDVFA